MNGSPVKIGLWGGSSSGKTTFLKSLAAAARSVSWVVGGSGEHQALSDEYLDETNMARQRDNAFSDATELEFVLQWRFAPGAGMQGTAFELTVRDVKGGWHETPTAQTDYVQYLADCAGLIYLFDPILDSDPEAGNHSTRNTDRMLRELTRIAAPGRRAGAAPLRHHVAVCVTKFDHPHFFPQLRAAGWATQDRDGQRQPRVKDRHAPAFFDWLCDRDVEQSYAREVKELITTHFAADRISYFVTSAIGFRLHGPGVTFDPTSDYVNFNEQGRGKRAQIIGDRRPINVIEPVLRLVESISRTPEARA